MKIHKNFVGPLSGICLARRVFFRAFVRPLSDLTFWKLKQLFHLTKYLLGFHILRLGKNWVTWIFFSGTYIKSIQLTWICESWINFKSTWLTGIYKVWIRHDIQNQFKKSEFRIRNRALKNPENHWNFKVSLKLCVEITGFLMNLNLA